MRKFLGILVLILVAATAQAQETWEVVLYIESSPPPDFQGQLLLIRGDATVSSIALPTELSHGGAGDSRRTILISPDRRYVVMSESLPESDSDYPLRVADLATGNCCLETPPLENLLGFSFAGFEPDGTRFAFSYVHAATDPTQLFEGGLMVVDAASGMVVAQQSMQAIRSQIDIPEFAVWALMGTWETDGIRFTPNCYACGGVFDGEYALWQPDSNRFLAQSGVFFSGFLQRLETTHESLLMTQNRSFAYDPSEGYFPISNVVHYYHAGEDVDFSTAQPLPTAPVVYHDLEAPALEQIHWVADGNAFLVIPSSGEFWDIIYRNGQRERFRAGIDPNLEFLVGTPDGWLERTIDESGNLTIIHHQMDGTRGFVTSLIAGSTVRVIDAPELGLSLENPPGFLLQPPPPVEEIQTTCPGFLPSRLVIGQRGRVTPGDPNRMREAPNTSSQIIGQIPGEGVFTVLEGPICDHTNGIAWWNVDYQGLIGWTAEGQGASYWIEPLQP